MNVGLPWPLRIAARRVGQNVGQRVRRYRVTSRHEAVFQGRALSWSHVGQALEIELHKQPCNEIGTTSLDELERVADCIQAGANEARAVIFFSSTEKGFCAGADLLELYQGLLEHRGASRVLVPVKVRSFLDRIHHAFNIIDAAPITTIAAVHGFCFGGGFELALTCDQIVADKSARFAFPELRLGLVPGFGGIPRLSRDVGNGVVRDLLLTGRSMNANRAHQLGLVAQVVNRGGALEAARRIAEQAARFDRETTVAAKAFAKPIPYADLEREKDVFLQLLASPTVRQALKKFSESDDVRPYLP